MKQKQMWMCVKCEMSGVVHFEEHAGVYEVVELLRQSHRKVSPNCDGSKLRVVVDTAAEQKMHPTKNGRGKRGLANSRLGLVGAVALFNSAATNASR